MDYVHKRNQEMLDRFKVHFSKDSPIIGEEVMKSIQVACG